MRLAGQFQVFVIFKVAYHRLPHYRFVIASLCPPAARTTFSSGQGPKGVGVLFVARSVSILSGTPQHFISFLCASVKSYLVLHFSQK
jgi:hypothetical protein